MENGVPLTTRAERRVLAMWSGAVHLLTSIAVQSLPFGRWLEMHLLFIRVWLHILSLRTLRAQTIWHILDCISAALPLKNKHTQHHLNVFAVLHSSDPLGSAGIAEVSRTMLKTSAYAVAEGLCSCRRLCDLQEHMFACKLGLPVAYQVYSACTNDECLLCTDSTRYKQPADQEFDTGKQSRMVLGTRHASA